MKLSDRFAAQLKMIRKSRGLTQEQLAQLIDRSSDAVSNLERGLSLPNFETLERLAQKLDVPVREFFDFEETSNSSSRRRIELLTRLNEIARALDDDVLEVAVGQLEVLHSGSPDRN